MKQLELMSSAKIPDLKEIMKIFERLAKVKIVDIEENLHYNSDSQNLQVYTTISFEHLSVQ